MTINTIITHSLLPRYIVMQIIEQATGERITELYHDVMDTHCRCDTGQCPIDDIVWRWIEREAKP